MNFRHNFHRQSSLHRCWVSAPGRAVWHRCSLEEETGLYSLFLAISCQLGEAAGHPACNVSSGLWDNKIKLVIKGLKSCSDLFESLPELSIIFCLSTIAKVHLFITMTNNPHVHSSSDLLCNCFAFLKRKTNHQSKARCKILIFKKQMEVNNSLKWTTQNINQLLIQHDKI